MGLYITYRVYAKAIKNIKFLKVKMGYSISTK